MNKNRDISARFGDLYLVHQNIPGKKHRELSHPEHIVFLPLQGEIHVDTASASFRVGPGKLLYLPKNETHNFGSSDERGERLIALIGDRFWKRTGGMQREAVALPAPQLSKELLFFLLLNPKTRHAASLASVFVETLQERLEEGSNPLELAHVEGRVRDARVAHALSEMKTRLEEPLSMELIAKKSGLSVRNLNRRVFEETGLSPKQLLIRYRIERACAIFDAGRSGVLETALAVGYNSLGPFIAAFQKLTGQLPSEYARHGSRRSGQKQQI